MFYALAHDTCYVAGMISILYALPSFFLSVFLSSSLSLSAVFLSLSLSLSLLSVSLSLCLSPLQMLEEGMTSEDVLYPVPWASESSQSFATHPQAYTGECSSCFDEYPGTSKNFCMCCKIRVVWDYWHTPAPFGIL